MTTIAIVRIGTKSVVIAVVGGIVTQTITVILLLSVRLERVVISLSSRMPSSSSSWPS